MYRNTFDQFQGSWWGGIIGQYLGRNWLNQQLSISATRDLLAQPWLAQRQQISHILLEQKLEPDQPNHLFSSLVFPATGESQNAVNCWKYHNSLLSILPLVLFSPDLHNLCSKIFTKDNLKSSNPVINSSPEQDVLIWSYLLIKVMNHPTNPWSEKLVTEEIFTDYQVATSPLTEKLRLVTQGINHGVSLHQLAEQIYSPKQLQATAIALSWYCFATTPHDFQLSIQRAARIEPPLADLTIVLTGTLSGTYNGMTTISKHWRVGINNHQHWHAEQDILVKLFKSWLGVYSEENNNVNYDLELNAIALPGSIQPRQGLKIISQSSSPY